MNQRAYAKWRGAVFALCVLLLLGRGAEKHDVPQATRDGDVLELLQRTDSLTPGISEDGKAGKILALTSSSSSVSNLPTDVTSAGDGRHDIRMHRRHTDR